MFSSKDKILTLFVGLRFNQLAVGSTDERTFAHLSNLQVLDISSGTTDVAFNRDKMDDHTQLGEEEEEEEDRDEA